MIVQILQKCEMRLQSTIISLLYMYWVHLLLPELSSVLLVSLNVIWNIRNEVDKTFVITKINWLSDMSVCKISIRMICSIIDKRLDIFAAPLKLTSWKVNFSLVSFQNNWFKVTIVKWGKKQPKITNLARTPQP